MAFEAPRVRLTGICGLGERGGEVLGVFATHLATLPEALRLAVATAAAKGSSDLEATLTGLEDQLLRRQTVEAIEGLGWRVEGREGIAVELDLVVVGGFQEAQTARSELEASGRRWQRPGIRLRWVCLCDSVAGVLEEALRWPENQPLDLVGTQCSSNLRVDPGQLPSVVAAFLMAFLIPDLRARLEVGSQVASLGAAGYYGPTGLLYQRLGAFVARRLIELHLREEGVRTGRQLLPGELEKFLANFSPEELALRLFDPRLFDELHMRPIPAVPQWTGDGTLLVRLDRAAIALELEGLSPRLWSDHIRRFSRGFDMSLATVWRQKMGRAARVLREEIAGSFLPRFQELLGRLAFSPAWMRRLLAELRQRLQARRPPLPMESGDLKPALESLDKAVAALPNMVALVARTLLWVLPAAVVGTTILFAAYPPPRAWALTTLLLATAAVVTVGGVLGPWMAARGRLYAARDRAVDLVHRRQEAIVSQNALAYLQDLVATLSVSADRAQRCLEDYCARLREAAQKLHEELETPFEEDSFFAPVVARPQELEAFFQRLGIDEELWLKEAVAQGLFAVTESGLPNSWWLKLTAWCAERLSSGATGVGVPSFGDLWMIRSEVRGEPPIGEALQRLWQKAEPLCECEQGSTERAVFLLPVGLRAAAGVAWARLPQFRPEEGLVEANMPLLICVRRRYHSRPVGRLQ